MSTLELHVDVDVPVDRAWETLHRVENYPRFVQGVRGARTEAGGRAHLDLEAGGRAREVEAEVTDRGEHVMEWLTTSAPELTGSFSVQPIDQNHTRIQARLEYDPGTVRDAFGGPKGFAQTNAIERLVRSDLEHFKEYVERG
ncbi:polyketide cyclase/dehydrase/lipid transport protein [Streptomyces puniciscabiei]|uniref:Polyketide cyclase/dehydrase/lipid transport protein n=1 Tax=Streptomyces puniciscabiei TaxID=164348 RepID=A0A542UAJ5_9ACTN|nr:SRPBCC family protein [Streptomyces puniciscabiei]TQK96068.1 polyketide cyclase/dehydrase/lipid transport protein [Streptomyces puniciscabiei]